MPLTAKESNVAGRGRQMDQRERDKEKESLEIKAERANDWRLHLPGKARQEKNYRAFDPVVHCFTF